jgi:hypothetical protein
MLYGYLRKHVRFAGMKGGLTVNNYFTHFSFANTVILL